jgi:hypothetical protein
MLINHDQAHITQDDSSCKTSPASVGSATLLQVYRSEGCRCGWDVALLLPLPGFIDATMHLSMARDHDGGVSLPGCIEVPVPLHSVGGSVFRDRIMLCIPKHAHGRCVLLVTRRSMLPIIVITHHKWPNHTLNVRCQIMPKYWVFPLQLVQPSMTAVKVLLLRRQQYFRMKYM